MFIVSDVRLDCYLARQRSQPSTDATGDGDLDFVEGWSIGFAYTPPDAMCKTRTSVRGEWSIGLTYTPLEAGG